MGFLPSIGLLKLCILVLLCAPKMEKEKARILIGMANPKKKKKHWILFLCPDTIMGRTLLMSISVPYCLCLFHNFVEDYL